MEELIGKIVEPNVAIFLCAIFIAGDIIVGLLKAWKNKNLNSTVGRDGFIKKLGWIVGLLLGYGVLYITKINIILMLTASTCIVTEFISILENLSEIGVNVKFLGKHLEKVEIEEEKEEVK